MFGLFQVKTLKERVQALKGDDYPTEGQKLIYSGKILSDETALKEYSIEESKFIVVMVSKPKVAVPVAAPPAAATAAAPATTTESSSTTPAAPSSTVTPATPTTETGTTPVAASAPATG
jgi:UV excision repair protein RAD23